MRVPLACDWSIDTRRAAAAAAGMRRHLRADPTILFYIPLSLRNSTENVLSSVTMSVYKGTLAVTMRTYREILEDIVG